MADVHVVTKGDRWEVELEGTTVSSHDTEDEAVSAGRDEARGRGGDLVIHREDGEARERVGGAGEDRGDPDSPGMTLDDPVATAEPNEPA